MIISIDAILDDFKDFLESTQGQVDYISYHCVIDNGIARIEKNTDEKHDVRKSKPIFKDNLAEINAIENKELKTKMLMRKIDELGNLPMDDEAYNKYFDALCDALREMRNE